MHERRKAIVLGDIAERCGVSKRTVSATLNPRSASTTRVGKETRERILATAKALGYRPNRTIRNFFSKRHNAIGVLLSNLWQIPQTVLVFMLRHAAQMGLLVELEEIPADLTSAPRLVSEDCVDGIILYGESERGWRAENWYGDFTRHAIPVLEVNTNNRRGPGSVTFNDEEACRDVMKLLRQCGRCRVGFLANERAVHYSTNVRVTALGENARRLEMEYIHGRWNAPEQHTPESFRPFEAFLHSYPELDCMVLEDALEAPLLYEAARRLDKRIPDDLAVVAFNDNRIADALFPRLTTVDVNQVKLAVRIVDEMVARASEPDRPWHPLVTPYRLRLRGSTPWE